MAQTKSILIVCENFYQANIVNSSVREQFQDLRYLDYDIVIRYFTGVGMVDRYTKDMESFVDERDYECIIPFGVIVAHTDKIIMPFGVCIVNQVNMVQKINTEYQLTTYTLDNSTTLCDYLKLTPISAISPQFIGRSIETVSTLCKQKFTALNTVNVNDYSFTAMIHINYNTNTIITPAIKGFSRLFNSNCIDVVGSMENIKLASHFVPDYIKFLVLNTPKFRFVK